MSIDHLIINHNMSDLLLFNSTNIGQRNSPQIPLTTASCPNLKDHLAFESHYRKITLRDHAFHSSPYLLRELLRLN